MAESGAKRGWMRLACIVDTRRRVRARGLQRRACEPVGRVPSRGGVLPLPSECEICELGSGGLSAAHLTTGAGIPSGVLSDQGSLAPYISCKSLRERDLHGGLGFHGPSVSGQPFRPRRLVSASAKGTYASNAISTLESRRSWHSAREADDSMAGGGVDPLIPEGVRRALIGHLAAGKQAAQDCRATQKGFHKQAPVWARAALMGIASSGDSLTPRGGL
jgi:hypothetical protein